MSCDVKIEPRDVGAYSANVSCEDQGGDNCVLYDTKRADGMVYGIFYGSSSQGGLHVVNLTKDALEVELLRRQIVKFDRENRSNEKAESN